MQMTPVRSLTVEPGCLLPENFTGEWVNTANIDASVKINSTHIIEEWNPDVGRWRKVIFWRLYILKTIDLFIFLGDLHLRWAEGLPVHDGEADSGWMVSQDWNDENCWNVNYPLPFQPSWLPVCGLCSSASQHHQVKYKELFTLGSLKLIPMFSRFRKGVVFAKNDFNTVCSWVQFPNDAAWKYDIMISKSSSQLPQYVQFGSELPH